MLTAFASSLKEVYFEGGVSEMVSIMTVKRQTISDTQRVVITANVLIALCECCDACNLFIAPPGKLLV